MKIREIGIRNCLSFCDKGLNEDNRIELADFNLFIGGNNAGKSNILRLLTLLDSTLGSLRRSGNESLEQFPLSIAGDANDLADWFFAQNTETSIEFHFSLEIEETDAIAQQIGPYEHESRDAVSFMFGLKQGWPKLVRIGMIIQSLAGAQPRVTISRIDVPNDHKVYSKDPCLFDRATEKILGLRPEGPGDREVWKLRKAHNAQEWTNDFQQMAKHVYAFLSQLYDRSFQGLVMRIGAIREIRPIGDEITETLFALRDGSPEAKRLFSSVQKHIEDLVFSEERQAIEPVFPPSDGGQRGLKIQIGEMQLPLSRYGSGVEQTIALATRIVREGPGKVVLIEEPEAHFHPELQRKFIKFLRQNQSVFGHQYLIATHSNVFIDEFFDMGHNIFYVFLDEDDTRGRRFTQVELLNRGHESLPALLRDLGARPSDLLMANGVLVVEGPTDRNVYMDWARKLDMPFEGISLEVIDAEGAGNIPKYLGSALIRASCFRRVALCDKNAEEQIRNQLSGLVPDENIFALTKGDLEDYYPRELVLEFAAHWAERKGNKDKVPSAIEPGQTVMTLNGLLNGEWWKRPLADEVIRGTQVVQIDSEIRNVFAKIHDSVK